MNITVTVEISDSARERVVVAEFERDEKATAASLGLTLAGAKGLLCQLQHQLVNA